MKTPEDEAFEDIARRQGAWGGGFQAKRQAAMDKVNEKFYEEYIKYRTAFPKNYTFPAQEQNTITFSTSSVDWVMRITADRCIEVNEGVEVTEAAKKVLEAMQWMLKPAQEPKRPWVGLTDEDRKAVLLTAYKEWECEELLLCAREDYLLIEQALKEKNT